MPKLSDSLLNSGILFYSRVFSLFYWNHAAKLAGLHFDLRFSKIIFHAFQAVFFCCWWFEKFSFQTKTFLLQKLAKYHPFGFRLKPYFLLLAMAESEFFLLMSFLLELLLFFQLLIFIFCRLDIYWLNFLCFVYCSSMNLASSSSNEALISTTGLAK